MDGDARAGRRRARHRDAHVDTPEEAKAVAAALRYLPQGHRSVAGGLAASTLREASARPSICAAINPKRLMVIVMLETPLAIRNAEATAAVPGIDSLLIGTNDLAMELGIPGGFGDERVVAAYQSVVDACRKHGKHAGVGGISRTKKLPQALYRDGGSVGIARQRPRLPAKRGERYRRGDARLPLKLGMLASRQARIEVARRADWPAFAGATR